MKLTGGTFDRSVRPRLFAASSPTSLQDAMNGGYHVDTLLAMNKLGRDVSILERALARGYTVLFDSGIFELTNIHKRAHGCTMDDALALAPEEIDGFDDLFAVYVAVARTYGERVWGYIELDQGGRENKIRTRARLEALGLRPIPVYHPLNDGWDYFDALAQEYDRICVGNLVQAKAPIRRRLMATLFERRQRYPDLWIHALGVGPCAMLNAFPTDSADASSWIAAAKFGTWHPRADMVKGGYMAPEFLYAVGNGNDGPTSGRNARDHGAMEFLHVGESWRRRTAALKGAV